MTELIRDNNRFAFVASTTNVLLIYQLINSISAFGDDCFLNINKGSLCFSISANNTCKVILTLDRRLFSYYEFHPDKNISHNFAAEGHNRTNNTNIGDSDSFESETEVDEDDIVEDGEIQQNITININLLSLLETINIHIPNEREQTDTKTKCTLGYQFEGAPFILTFEDDLIVERCELMTYFVDPETRSMLRPKDRHRRNNRQKSKRSNDQSMNSNSNDDEDDILDNYDQMIDDNTIFQLDADRVIFESVMKSAIFYDALKDMKDLNTDEFVLYCSTKEKSNSDSNLAGKMTRSSKRLIFISKSDDTSIGYSKLIVPDEKPFLRELEVFKPSSDNIREPDEADFIMVPCSASVSSFYHFEYFAKIIKAIKLSKLIKIRKDMNGITSFLILVGSGSLTRNTSYKDKHEFRNHNMGEGTNVAATNTQLFYGTSIEFITLESIPLEDRILSEELDEETLSKERSSEDMKYGYDNLAIEKMIHNEETIKTIEITGDGQLLTIDDFFTSQIPENHQKVNKGGSQHTQLKITEELTRSVLGLGNGPTNDIPISRKRIADDEDQADNDMNDTDSRSEEDNETGEDHDDVNRDNDSKKRRDESDKGKRKRKKGRNKRIETVGGAIEIPLFI